MGRLASYSRAAQFPSVRRLEQCLREEETCVWRLRGLLHVLLKGAELNPEPQIHLVNRYVNSQHYEDDCVRRDAAAGKQWETLT